MPLLPPPPPPPASPAPTRIPAATRRRGSAPELAVRIALCRLGLSFAVDRRPFPQTRRRADAVFAAARVAVFVDGCFWHACPEHGRLPRANRGWWELKFASIRARDADVAREFAAHGWTVVRVWEHEDPCAAAARIAALVAPPGLPARPPG